MNLEKRDLAIAKIEQNMKNMEIEMQNVYDRLKKEDKKNELVNELLKEHETIVKAEEQIKKKQIKKLKELYNYINRQTKKNEEDKKAILIEIEHLMRK